MLRCDAYPDYAQCGVRPYDLKDLDQLHLNSRRLAPGFYVRLKIATAHTSPELLRVQRDITPIRDKHRPSCAPSHQASYIF